MSRGVLRFFVVLLGSLVALLPSSLIAQNIVIEMGRQIPYVVDSAICNFLGADLKVRVGDADNKRLGYLSLQINNFRSIAENARSPSLHMTVDHPTVGSVKFYDREGRVWENINSETAPTSCDVTTELVGAKLTVLVSCKDLQIANYGSRTSVSITDNTPIECNLEQDPRLPNNLTAIAGN